MNKRSFFWLLFSFVSLTFLLSCAIPHSRNRDEIPEFIKKTCREEYGLDVRAWDYGESLWVFCSEAPMPPPSSAMTLKPKRFYNIRELDVERIERRVDYSIDAFAETGPMPEASPYHQNPDFTEKLQSFQRAIAGVAWRANLTLNKPFRFNVIIVTSPEVDYIDFYIYFFPDMLKINMNQISRDEFQDRVLAFRYLHPHARIDDSGSFITPYDLPPNEFVATLLQNLIIKDINRETQVVADNPDIVAEPLKSILDIAEERTQSLMPIYLDVHTFHEVNVIDNFLENMRSLQFMPRGELVKEAFTPKDTVSRMFTVQFYYMLAATYFQAQEYEDVLWYCDKIFRVDPEYPFARVLKAQVHSINKNFPEAIAIHESVIAKYPRFLYALQGLANAYQQSGDHLKALTAYENISKYYPDLWFPHYGRGYSYYALSRNDEAIEAYQESLDVLEKKIASDKKKFFENVDLKQADKDRATIKKAIGEVYIAKKTPHLALRYFEQTFALSDDDFSQYFDLGRLALLRGEPAVAVTQFKKSLEVDQESLSANWYAGKAYEQLGQYSRAREYYQKALLLEPDDVQRRDIYLGIAMTYLQERENPSKALFYFNYALNLVPESTLIKYYIGRTYAIMENYSQAEDYFKQAIEGDSTFANAHRDLGLLYFRQKEYVKAKENLIKAKELFEAQGDNEAADELQPYMVFDPEKFPFPLE